MVRPENQPVIVEEIVSLLETNWTPANTRELSFAPDISPGWYQADNPRPHVTVSTPQTSTQSESGYDFMTGNGPGKSTLGSVDANAWLRRNMKDPNDNDITIIPQITGEEIVHEIERIVMDNLFAVSEWEMMGTTDSVGEVLTDQEVTAHQFPITIVERHLVRP